MASIAVNEDFVVRALREGDEAAIVRIDARSVGRRRAEFLHVKLGQAFADTGVALSLVAELDGASSGSCSHACATASSGSPSRW